MQEEAHTQIPNTLRMQFRYYTSVSLSITIVLCVRSPGVIYLPVVRIYPYTTSPPSFPPSPQFIYLYKIPASIFPSYAEIMEKAHCLETDPLPHQFSSSSPFPPFQAFGPFATSFLYPGSLESVLKYAQLFSFRKKKIVLNLWSTFYPLFLPFVHRDVLKLNR